MIQVEDIFMHDVEELIELRSKLLDFNSSYFTARELYWLFDARWCNKWDMEVISNNHSWLSQMLIELPKMYYKIRNWNSKVLPDSLR